MYKLPDTMRMKELIVMIAKRDIEKEEILNNLWLFIINYDYITLEYY